jgi:phosphate transport system substrate-binding protein
VEGVLPGESAPKVIDIEAQGSATAFTSLGDERCDVGMASRRIKPEEASKLSSLGDMTSPASEHVLAVDGIAVIVNRSNPITGLTVEQIAQIFSGAITDWAGVHGSAGPINVYARDDKSGTYDTFKTLVLGSAPLVGSAKRFEDSRALSDAVAGHAGGIGFIGLPFVRDAKAIAVSEAAARPLLPNRFTVATEDYPLSRRLFLYTPAIPQNPFTRKFVEFSLSRQGQDLVEANGFIGQNVKTVEAAATVDPQAPNSYKSLTQGAERMSLNFRFRTGSADLDNKAMPDLDRVITFLTDLHYSGQNILLFGFADSTGTAQANDALSKNRAQAVAQQFEQRGVRPATITGFGSQLPVASNTTDDGRAKNRRVEIWLRK